MNENEIIHRIEDIISNEVLHRKVELSAGENIKISDLGIDSLRMLTLLTRIEIEFSITVEDEYWSLEKLSTVKELTQYIVDMFSKGENNEYL